MDKKYITINNIQYLVEIAKTEQERVQGLQGREQLLKNEGMLFEFPEEGTHKMWMKNTLLDLDQIAINEDQEVVYVHSAKAHDETLVDFPNSKWILELNANSGVKEGDEFEFDDSDDPSKYTMKILAPDGSIQYSLQGSERIFSRKSTIQMINWAKKAKQAKGTEKFDKFCRRLGKRMFRELYDQDNRKPEYVEVPD